MRPFHKHQPYELAALDIAELNLECATDLPGSENLNIPECLAKLDDWAEIVHAATLRHWPRFERDPADYENSVPYFCMLVMLTVLQRNLGVRYNLDSWERPYDGTDSRPHFVHGILDGQGGTCESMPVLYVAVGRRLGYPLKIVPVYRHFIVRWDDPATGTRLNIESTCQGLKCEPDEYYLTWPDKLSPESVAEGWMLQSMTPTEELAMFYSIRAYCLRDWCEYREMLELTFHANHLLSEKNPIYRQRHALATLLYRQFVLRDVQYGADRQTGEVFALENGERRKPHPFEAWCAQQAYEDFARLKEIHEARRARKARHAGEQFFADLATGSDDLTQEALHSEESFPCTTHR